MAWQVAIVFDQGESQETLQTNLYILLGQMPVWAVARYERVPGAAELRKQWDSCWFPEPGLTVALPGCGEDRIAEAINLIPTIQEHHCRMTAVRLFGIEASRALTESFANLGFCPISGTTWDGIGFARPLSEIENVPVIQFNASDWKTESDFFNAFLSAVGAPDWHGRNFNALHDSIGAGGINKLEVPYRMVVQNLNLATAEVREFMTDFADLIKGLQTNGCPVGIEVEQ